MKWFLATIALAVCGFTPAAEPRIPVAIDTDIGADIDDAFALALVVASTELELRGVTTVGRAGGPDPYVQHISTERDEDRAWLVCRFLTQVGVKGVPVAAGANPQPRLAIDWQIQYRRHPAAIYNRTLKPVKEPAAELLARLATEADGELTIIALGPLTNIARLIKDHPAAAKKIKRIVLMGGSLAIGYDGKPMPEPEWNIATDIAAAKIVFGSGLPLTVVPLDATATVKLEKKNRETIFAAHTPLTFQVQNLYELWDQETPILFDPVTVMSVIDAKALTFKDLRVTVDDKGLTTTIEGKANARVAVSSKTDVFLPAFVERLRKHGQESLPAAPKHAAKLIEPGGFPTRVHAFEDYETNIEKRWWMCGKLETKDVARTGGRSQRGVLTQDFDDRQGATGTMYRAVIFNPVPGPPMGPNTRLRFRYKLTGTDTLRVQLYSLTNGYHRYLSVSGLESGKWLDGCVDMTQMRRPDGSGGPLATDERIDDIQFYVDPRAELLIDDVVLFEAGAKDEKREFPKRVHYTGLFDTGKQGKEWAGDFEIVPHDKPKGWKAAKSVPRKPDGRPWIRLDLRGERPLDRKVELAFQYQIAETAEVKIELYSRAEKTVVASHTAKLVGGKWAELTVLFAASALSSVDEIRFVLEEGDLRIDDVLLYTPGG